eukprot:TRINITY_DN41408_c0_g1_i1.p1 TRINITY_DN41408_c0_g1~~TRINITY_DN41408_c0_g1_i1.p1  ORF type:complete len:601 (+),score=82.28 TRINITY_DN41408_c0_g1_i1:23-1825(+)
MLQLAAACFLLQTRQALCGQSMSQKFEQDALAAASINRVVGGYNNDTMSCQWPKCAPTCMTCPSAKVGNCLFQPFESCPVQSGCLYGMCFCNDGYCPSAGNTCVWRTCSLGAQPPPYMPSRFAQTFASLGPQPPKVGSDGLKASIQAWKDFFWGNTKLPIIVFAAGVVISFLTFACVACHLECECSWLPSQPWILLVLCIITVGVTLAGIMSRASIVSQSFSDIEEQLQRMQSTMTEAVTLSSQLKRMCASLQAQIDGLPGSCNKFFVGSNDVMKLAAAKANTTLLSMEGKIDTFSKMSVIANHYIGVLQKDLGSAQHVMVLYPMLPVTLLLLGVVIIAVATVVSMLSKDPNVAERADFVISRFGSFTTCIVMIVASALSAGYLFFGMLMGSFCVDIDMHVTDIISAINFTALSKKPYNIDPILKGAVSYYIHGSQANPMIQMVQSAQNDAKDLYTIYTNATWATQPAGDICKGVENLNPGVAMGNFDASSTWLISTLRASELWPYYKTFAQEIGCGNMLESITYLVVLTILVSHFLMPLITIFADIDFRRWTNYKSDNYHEHYNVGDVEEPDFQKQPMVGGRSLVSPGFNGQQQGGRGY